MSVPALPPVRKKPAGQRLCAPAAFESNTEEKSK